MLDKSELVSLIVGPTEDGVWFIKRKELHAAWLYEHADHDRAR